MHCLKFNSEEEFLSMRNLLPENCPIDVIGTLYENPVPIEWYHVNTLWDLPDELKSKEIFPSSPSRVFL